MSNMQRARQLDIHRVEEGPRILRLPSTPKNTIRNKSTRFIAGIALLFGSSVAIRSYMQNNEPAIQEQKFSLPLQPMESMRSTNEASKPVKKPAPQTITERHPDHLTPKLIELYNAEIDGIIGILEREPQRKPLSISLAQDRYEKIVYLEQLLKGERRPADEADPWEHAMPKLREDTIFAEQQLPGYLERIEKTKVFYGEYLDRQQSVSGE